MYKDYYKMKREAFVNQPLADMFFSSRSHKEGWHYLAYGINSKEPFMLLCGDYGMGKTTLCLKLVQSLKESGKLSFVFLSTPIYSYKGLLTKIAACLDIPLESSDESLLQEMIVKYFENDHRSNGVVIIFDDAQEIDVTILKKIRMLASFNMNGNFPIRVLFFAHLSFLDKLNTSELLPLNQRIKRRFYLEPLDFSESKEYIYFRMVRAGGSGVPAFAEAAIQMIFNYSKGVPRSINNICDTCLLLGASGRLQVLDESLVSRAIKFIEGSHLKPKPTTSETGGLEIPDRATEEGAGGEEFVPIGAVDKPSGEPAVTLGVGGMPTPEKAEPQRAARVSQLWDEDIEPSRVSLDFPAADDKAQQVELKVSHRGRFKFRDLIAVALFAFVLAMALAFFIDFKTITTLLDTLLRQ